MKEVKEPSTFSESNIDLKILNTTLKIGQMNIYQGYGRLQHP